MQQVLQAGPSIIPQILVADQVPVLPHGVIVSVLGCHCCRRKVPSVRRVPQVLAHLNMHRILLQDPNRVRDVCLVQVGLVEDRLGLHELPVLEV